MDITEKQFQQQIADLAKLFGWKYSHPWLSIHSPRGFPDCVLLRPPRLIFAELKTDRHKSKLSQPQASWLWELRKTPNLEVYVWRPRRINKIVEVLR